MKLLAPFAVFMFSGISLAAIPPADKVRILKDTTTNVVLELNQERVFCTDRGYGNVQLKVSVPDLDYLAHFDHRVAGERLPCVTGGQCKSSFNPSTILGSGVSFAVVPIRVVLKERISLLEAGCRRQLAEEVTATIEGFPFLHHSSDQGQNISLESCKELLNLF